MVRCLFPCGSGDSPRPCLMNLQRVLRSRQEKRMAYRIAGIDVHKKKLAVVVTDIEVHGAILETAVGCTRALLETDLFTSRRCRQDVGNASSGTSVVQSRTARAQ